MNRWLTYATDLVGIRKAQQLATLFIDTVSRELDLDTCLLLVPSADGRTLVPHRPDLEMVWSVSDFDCPFAHVLQSSKPMALSLESLVFWQSNRAFAQLTESVGMFDVVRIVPLPLHQDVVKTLLFLIGETEHLQQIFSDDDFCRYVDVFSQQWTLLTDIEREEQHQRDLRESLFDVERAREQQRLSDSLSQTLVGQSAPMIKLREQIVSAAGSQLSVMIQGDTGTGKELVAQAVHDLSERADQAFIAINCAAIPENLLESELFGYSKGAFSGAEADKQGLIAQANGGTLFLDEIGDMPLVLQAKLLRVLETRTFRPVGGKEELTSDFRLVSATHVNLLSQVRQKAFRQDLYYRLFQYPITVPCLTERIDDIALLSQHFVQLFNDSHGTQIRGLNYKAIDCLKQHNFNGNVRELKHLIEFGCAQTQDGHEVQVNSFIHRILPREEVNLFQVEEPESCTVIKDLKQAIQDFESKIIRERLRLFSGDRAKAAESLGIPKRTLAYKCQKLEIKAP
ncbi:sigma-54-dependent Fis family transcriptional regulator [Vibrio gazogenes]|uniref:Sigma-54 specific transcriptional regulator n=1 Tax=Vibrio gazogenes DSM 21264 = NBRC 103151 TaxID=1123492 RepID=A0A1M5GY60_VIBGA|nr:sigma 54-interacting transcriptional regulator [Vibrio gazogenes]USP15783.1 sigma 54-interacting transcriptional regulator [Vibrio gazogenes]SHG08669.1 sigma-54 specific transcriptional regulator [Vibrio gazogenes DSM 21264] [Vibrio gazogenes DSM 21264 = NBRC 103151]SJN52775.1 Transcriptional regulatory protein ZraR [Vibrio gazogenes]